MKSNIRKPLRDWEWWAIIILDLYTITAVLLRLMLSNNLEKLSLIDTILTLARALFFIYVSARLASWGCIYYFIVPDSIMLAGLVSTITYGYLGYTVKNENTARLYGTSSTICFLILILTFSGMFRAMLMRMEWTRGKVVFYKILRGYAIFFYLAVVLYMKYSEHNKSPTYNTTIFFLYTILNLGYLEVLYGTMSAFDQTAAMKCHFMIGPEAKKADKQAKGGELLIQY